MNKLDSLYLKIEESMSLKPRLILAIEGRAASGKTTLARDLAEKYDGLVFHMDDYFLPPELRTEARLTRPGENIHWERFSEEVLVPLQNSTDKDQGKKEIIYRKYDCKSQTLGDPIKVEATRLVIVEGVYSLHPNLSSIYDIKVFLTVDDKTQKERLAQRETLAMFQRFLDEWLPMENAYFDTFDVSTSCDLVLSDE